jgi:hypothetical protein
VTIRAFLTGGTRNGMPPDGGYTYRGRPRLITVNQAILDDRKASGKRLPGPPDTAAGRAPAREHGTDAGYRQHRRHWEPPCEPCSVAHLRANREYRQRLTKGRKPA